MALLRSQAEKDALTSKSSFMSVEKILSPIVERILSNERLKRLLYYTDKHALSLPKLTPQQSLSLIHTSIRIVPRLDFDPDIRPYIVLSLTNFTPLPEQNTFKSVTLLIDVLCHFEHWHLGDFKLRPYAILGEIDGMINRSFINSGLANFTSAQQLIINESFGGVSASYQLETFFDDYGTREDLKK